MECTGRPDIDYAALFAATPSPCLVLTPELIITDVNDAYLEVTGRERDELLGMHIFAAFPDNPDDPEANGEDNLRRSVRRALATRRPDILAPQKYDIPVPGRPGAFEERYWSTVNTPVLDGDGHPVLLIHRVEDVTGLVHGHTSPSVFRQSMEVFARAKELQAVNEQLRQARAHDREVALALQESMLPAGVAERHPDVAVRYRPAVDSLNVCGDWYELVELASDRLAVAVGDVVGNGLAAAGVMGQLRSALSAAIRAVGAPAGALEILGRYALSIEGAMATTVVQAVIDRTARTIAYSRSGHLPPMLLRPGGIVESLDQATDPPLGVQDEPVRPSEACTAYEPGSTLALYTDGLVERRGEDIDAGLGRLAASLTRHGALAPEPLADALLADLGVHGRTGDDTALVVIRV